MIQSEIAIREKMKKGLPLDDDEIHLLRIRGLTDYPIAQPQTVEVPDTGNALVSHGHASAVIETIPNVSPDVIPQPAGGAVGRLFYIPMYHSLDSPIR